MNWLAFLIAAGFGGAIRYVFEHRYQPIGKHGFPKATLIVNVLGAFILGLVFTAPNTTYLVFGTAFCGALTTFSGISAQLMRRVNSGAVGAALSYLAITLVIGLSAAELGLLLGKLIFS